MIDIITIITHSFLYVGFILSIVSLFYSSAILNITCYSLLITGLVLLISKLLLNINSSSWIDFLNILKINISPFLIVLLLLSYLLYLTISYQKKIEEGHLTNTFYIFNNISILLICLQFVILQLGMNEPVYKQKQIIPLKYSSFIYLICLINTLFVMTMGTILKYFSADG
jgi:hypothetical protein